MVRTRFSFINRKTSLPCITACPIKGNRTNFNKVPLIQKFNLTKYDENHKILGKSKLLGYCIGHVKKIPTSVYFEKKKNLRDKIDGKKCCNS